MDSVCRICLRMALKLFKMQVTVSTTTMEEIMMVDVLNTHSAVQYESIPRTQIWFSSGDRFLSKNLYLETFQIIPKKGTQTFVCFLSPDKQTSFCSLSQHSILSTFPNIHIQRYIEIYREKDKYIERHRDRQIEIERQTEETFKTFDPRLLVEESDIGSYIYTIHYGFAWDKR